MLFSLNSRKYITMNSDAYITVENHGHDRRRQPHTVMSAQELPRNLKPCILDTIGPVATWLQACEDALSRHGESLWAGTMKVKDLENSPDPDVRNEHVLYNSILPFFDKPETVTWNKKLKKYDVHMPESWRPQWAQSIGGDMSVEMLCKALWLATEFLDNDKSYDNPMCAHFSPIYQTNIVHPGGMRKKLIKMYCPPEQQIPMFYFNTGGFYYHDYMENLKRINYEQLITEYFPESLPNGGMVAEHGTLIPHVFRTSDTILDRQYEFLDLLHQKISAPNFTIGIDCDWAEDYRAELPFILPRSDCDQAQCQVSVNTKLSLSESHNTDTKYYRDIIISQAIIHLILSRPYSDGLIDIDIKS